VVKSLKDKLRQRYNVSVSEVDMQELVGRCHLAIITVSSDKVDAEKRLNAAGELLDQTVDIQVVDRTITWL